MNKTAIRISLLIAPISLIELMILSFILFTIMASPTRVVETAETETVETAETVETVETAETAETVETVETAETAKTTETPKGLDNTNLAAAQDQAAAQTATFETTDEATLSINVTKQNEIDFEDLIDLSASKAASVSVATTNLAGYTLYADATGEYSLGAVHGNFLTDYGPLKNSTIAIAGSKHAIKDSTTVYIENQSVTRDNRRKAVDMKLTALANPTLYHYELNYHTENSRNIEAYKISNIPDAESTNRYEERTMIFIVNKTIPTALGYNFIGWSTSPNGSPQYQPGDKIIIHYDDPVIHLYPAWEPANFQLGINKGEHIDLVTGAGSHAYLSDVTITTSASAGYHFDHWETSSSEVKLEDPSATTTTFKMPPENITLTAEAATNNYRIKYHANNGQVDPSMEPDDELIPYTRKATLSDGVGFSRYGYVLIGWSIGTAGPDGADPDYELGAECDMSELTKRVGAEYQAEGTIDLYAVWQPYWDYQIIYDVNGGWAETTPSPQFADGEISSQYTFEITDTIPSRKDHATGPYMFIGWASTPDATVAEYSAFGDNDKITLLGTPGEPNAIKTLYAVWRKVFNYELSYAPGTTEPVTNLPQLRTLSSIGDGVFALGEAPSRRGYTFQGYSDDGGETLYPAGSRYTIPKSEVGTDPIEKTVTAIWTPNYYDITIKGEHFTSDASTISVAYDHFNKVTITPEKGYYLTGLVCPNGYTCSTIETGENNSAAHEAQTITITNNLTIAPGVLTITTSNIYTVPIDIKKSVASADKLVFNYGETASVTVAKDYWYYLDNLGCPTGYICSGDYKTGPEHHDRAQTITIANDPNNFPNGGHLKINNEDYVAEMQTFSCNVLPAGVTKNVIDTRNNKKYTVARLKDNKCWMTQNLNIYGPITLTSADSNVTTNYALPASSASSWCLSISSWCYSQEAVRYSGNELYGTYYSWRSATAGVGTYSTSSGDAKASVCPKNWRLPTTTEQKTIWDKYGGTRGIIQDGAGEPAYVFSGEASGSNILSQGNYAFFWSSTARSTQYAYYLLYDKPTMQGNPQCAYEKFYGRTIRCVASS